MSKIEITKYFNYETRFNGVFFRDNLYLLVTAMALSNSHLKSDLIRINYWAYDWKMSFYPHSTKTAYFS